MPRRAEDGYFFSFICSPQDVELAKVVLKNLGASLSPSIGQGRANYLDESDVLETAVGSLINGYVMGGIERVVRELAEHNIAGFSPESQVLFSRPVVVYEFGQNDY